MLIFLTLRIYYNITVYILIKKLICVLKKIYKIIFKKSTKFKFLKI